MLAATVAGMWAATGAARRGRLSRVRDAIGIPDAPLNEATVDADDIAIALVELSRAAMCDASRAAFCALVRALNGLLGAVCDVFALSPAGAAVATTEDISAHAEYLAAALAKFLIVSRVPLAPALGPEEGEGEGEGGARSDDDEKIPTALLGMPRPLDAQWAAAELALLHAADARVALCAQALHAATLQHALACGPDLGALLLLEDDARA